MKATLLQYIVLAALTAASLQAKAVAPAAPEAGEASTTSAPAPAQIDLTAPAAVMPLELTAIDLVTKVYGMLDTGLSEKEAIMEAGDRFRLTPSADSMGLWLDSADGYVVSYYGLTPPISAVAHFDEGGASDFSYFFLFPYSAGERRNADSAQCVFCGYLLQEMNDLGLVVGVPDVTDSIFEVFGSYDDKWLNIRLVEQVHDDESGLFVLMLNVVPGAYTAADDILAIN